jgi:uncharacterized OB-fold protein
MSENPNPTRCGTCGTMNPPGQEFCIHCRAPLTMTAGADALEGTPEAADELEQREAGENEEAPGGVVLSGMGGAPIPVPGESLDPDQSEQSRD